MYCLHLERTEGNLNQGRYCDLQHATGRSLQGRQTDTRLYAFGSGSLLFASYFSILPHRYPETAYLYDFSVQSSKSDLFFCVKSEDVICSTAHTHARTHLYCYIFNPTFTLSLVLYIVLANPTLIFFGQEDQTAYYISATTFAIE
jgi:hypothetical protein